MKKLASAILILNLLSAACGNNGNSSSSFFDSDQTTEAGAIILDANNDLKEIKKIYKGNQDRVEELKAAIGGNEADKIDKIKSIAGELVNQINRGLVLADTAVAKIEKAEGMKINETYRDYLYKKKSALNKQIEAFKLRHKSAMALSEELDIADPEALKKAALILKVNEDEFQKKIEEGKNLSLEANQIAKDASRQNPGN